MELPTNLSDCTSRFAFIKHQAFELHRALSRLRDELDDVQADLSEAMSDDLDQDQRNDVLTLAGYDAADAAIEGYFREEVDA